MLKDIVGTFINSSSGNDSSGVRDFFEGAGVLSTSVGQSGNSSSITVPSGITKGILFICASGWRTQSDLYSVSGSGIISSTMLSSDSGWVNNSATHVMYEMDYVTLSPGQAITLSTPTQSGYPSYPCARMVLYY